MRWVRPLLLVVLLIGFFLATSTFVYLGKMNIEVFAATWTPVVSLMVGHLFGERSSATRKSDND